MHKDIERVLFSEEQIAEKVRSLSVKLNSDYKEKKPIIVSILKGSVIFYADLLKRLEFDCKCDFIIARSYGNKAFSSGYIEVIKDIDTDITGADLILLDDILDTGNTFSQLVHRFSERKPKSVKTIALLEKKIEHTGGFAVDYKCFDIENEFVVGYGLDYGEKYRNLPYIGVLKKKVYIGK